VKCYRQLLAAATLDFHGKDGEELADELISQQRQCINTSGKRSEKVVEQSPAVEELTE